MLLDKTYLPILIQVTPGIAYNYGNTFFPLEDVFMKEIFMQRKYTLQYTVHSFLHDYMMCMIKYIIFLHMNPQNICIYICIV